MKILFVSHDANRAGAQLFLLNIMPSLRSKGIDFSILLLDGGILINDWQKICKVYLFPKNFDGSKNPYRKAYHKLIKTNDSFQMKRNVLFDELKKENFDFIYANTIATSTWIQEIVQQLHIPLITHIHELSYSIQLYSEPKNTDYLIQESKCLIACSQAVADNLKDNLKADVNKLRIIHSFVDNEKILNQQSQFESVSYKEKYNLPTDKILVGGCGNAEWRKGIDLFTQIANQIENTIADKFHFVWIGVKKEGMYFEQIQYDIQKMGIENSITFIEPTPEALQLIDCLDIFTIVSREDPFPLVMLEAALLEKTIIGFDKTGGCSEFLREDCGVLVPYLDTSAMANGIIRLIGNQIYAKQLGKNARKKVVEQYSFEKSVEKLLTVLEEQN